MLKPVRQSFLVSMLSLLSSLALANPAVAGTEIFLSNDQAGSEVTYVIQFEPGVKGNLNKIRITLPPDTSAANAALGRLILRNKLFEDDEEDRKGVTLSVDPSDPNTLIVALRDERTIQAGTRIRIELFNLNNPPAGDHAINVSTLGKKGNVLELIPPIAFSTFATGTSDITAVNAGPGLTGGGASGDVTLSVDTSQIQKRVVGGCAAGSSIREIHATGTVTCETDDNSGGTVTSVGTGAGLTGGPITTMGTISVATGGITSAMIQDGTIGAADVNSAEIQRRVAGACAAGNAIRGINADGTVSCETAGGSRHSLDAADGSPTDAVFVDNDGNVSIGGNVTISGLYSTVSFGATSGSAGKFTVLSATDKILSGVQWPPSGSPVEMFSVDGGGIIRANDYRHVTAGLPAGFSQGITTVGLSAVPFPATSGPAGKFTVPSATEKILSGVQWPSSGSPVETFSVDGGGIIRANDYRHVTAGIPAGFSQGITTVGLSSTLTFGATSGSAGKFTVLSATEKILSGVQWPPSGSPVEVFSVDGNGDVTATSFTQASSRRWKTNIKPLTNALEKVERLRGVYFDWKGLEKRGIGLIAEEVGEVIPEVVKYEENGEEAKGVDYARIVTVLIEAMKQQQAQIRELKSELERLRLNR